MPEIILVLMNQLLQIFIVSILMLINEKRKAEIENTM